MINDYTEKIRRATARAIGEALIAPERQKALHLVYRTLAELRQDIAAIVLDDGKALKEEPDGR